VISLLDEEKLRKKLQNMWMRKIPVTPKNFADANVLINEVIKAATIDE
jgi:hypothetical protein